MLVLNTNTSIIFFNALACMQEEGDQIGDKLDVGTYLHSVFLFLILCSRISTSLSELSSSNLRVTTSEVLILLFDAWLEESFDGFLNDWLDFPCDI